MISLAVCWEGSVLVRCSLLLAVVRVSDPRWYPFMAAARHNETMIKERRLILEASSSRRTPVPVWVFQNRPETPLAQEALFRRKPLSSILRSEEHTSELQS